MLLYGLVLAQRKTQPTSGKSLTRNFHSLCKKVALFRAILLGHRTTRWIKVPNAQSLLWRPWWISKPPQGRQAAVRRSHPKKYLAKKLQIATNSLFIGNHLVFRRPIYLTRKCQKTRPPILQVFPLKLVFSQVVS